MSLTHNDLVDSHFELVEEIKQLKLKVADIEHGSRRNNIRFPVETYTNLIFYIVCFKTLHGFIN